jgi:hypothetical protein
MKIVTPLYSPLSLRGDEGGLKSWDPFGPMDNENLVSNGHAHGHGHVIF